MHKKGLISGKVIGGKFFTQEVYDFLMLRFKESFSHASLSVERAFMELDDVEKEFSSIKNEVAYDFYKLCDRRERSEIDRKLRRFIVFYGKNSAILTGDYNPTRAPQKIIDSEFNDNFKYMADDMHYVLEFNNKGEFLERETFRNIGDFFRLSFQKKNAEDRAYNMQKDHLDAFDYAMSLDKIGIKEIVDINEKVNHSDPNKEVGFKKTNNDIIGANFYVSDKREVPTKMQELLAEYKNDFGLCILDPSEKDISYEERVRRIQNIFRKEAMFHIKFERIHPFADGNGRTGRIIMNKHLMEVGMAPVLITGMMRDEYKDYIGSNDYEGLAKMMLSSSSQLLSNWVSMRNLNAHSNFDNSSLAQFVVDDNNSKVKRKRFIDTFPLL